MVLEIKNVLFVFFFRFPKVFNICFILYLLVVYYNSYVEDEVYDFEFKSNTYVHMSMSATAFLAIVIYK